MFPIVTAFGSGIFPIGLDIPAPPTVEPAALKAALRHLVGSVSVVTSGEGIERTGATVTSAYGLSVDPAAMIVAINRESSSYSTIRRYGHFCVNVLAEGQEDVANRFSGFGGVKGQDRYIGRPWTTGESGAPVLDDALLSIDCVLEDEIRKFSHAIFVGRVVSVDTREGRALLYGNGAYGALERPPVAE
jgi:flavin reductase (DIM6/NTAB) family NADH-FMN oxidoreductase RutF